jgi:hypothetical protein
MPIEAAKKKQIEMFDKRSDFNHVSVLRTYDNDEIK